MKLKNIFLIAAVAIVMVGCGGGGPATQEQAKVAAVQAAQPIQGFSAEQLNTVTTRSQTRMSMAQREPSNSIQGYRTNYTITVVDGSVSVLNNITKETTNYGKITSLQFVDTWISFDDVGPESQVFRLYQAAFNRKPDVSGLGFWIKAFKDGHTLQDIANGFVNSDEFKRMYGEAPTNETIIGKYYNNVLHRDAEKGGFDWWVQALKNGALRNEVLTGFSESDENKKNLKATLIAGFEYVPFQERTALPVLRSSYENKIAAAKVLGPQVVPKEVHESNSVAFADFFQDGSYSMVTHSLEYNYTKATANKFGSIKFYKKVGNDWVDTTAQLLTDTAGCLHPRKAIVADFNGDGKPDVFFACHGFDADDYPGEQPHMLLSQADGKYKNVTLPENCYCHSASAADVKGTGFAEILVTDNMQSKKPFFFANKNGTLTRDNTRFGDIYSQPNDGSKGMVGVSYGTPAIYTAELIDFYGTGKYDAFLAGTAPDNVWGDWAPTIFKNDGSGKFTQANSIQLPYDKHFESTLDIVFEAGTIYLTSVHENNQKGAETYGFSNIAKIDLATLKWTQLYANDKNYSNGHGWLNWIIPFNGTISSQIAQYNVVVPIVKG